MPNQPPRKPPGTEQTLGGDSLKDATDANDFTQIEHGHGVHAKPPPKAQDRTPATKSAYDPTVKAPSGPSARPTSHIVPKEVADALPSAHFGKFIREKLLGKGGMGEVWKAWDTELNRWVALKFLLGGDADEIARFKREAQTAGGLNHPNIAAIYEVGESRGRQFIAMQFIAGQTLKAFPRSNKRVLVQLVRDAAMALQVAHDQRIIHRDIKPENLMVVTRAKPATARTGKGNVAETHQLYVMDFGLARATEGASDLSVSGMVVGTPSYMPPEQARGEKANPQADIYSLGASLYELLTERKPFTGKNVYDTLRRLQEEEPKAPRKIDSSIDADLETIVLKCLEKDRVRRYRTAAELADDLSRWLEGEPIAARPATALYRLKKFAARRRAFTALVVVGVFALLVMAVIVPQWMKAKAWVEEGKRFQPLERELEVQRQKFYRSGFCLKDEDFEYFRGLTQRIRDQMKTTGDSAYGHYLIGKCRETAADFVEAESAYREGVARDASHPPSLLALGRLLIERALSDRSKAATDQERVSRASTDAKEGLDFVRRGAAAVGDEDRMERDLAEGYLWLIENWGSGRRFNAGPKLAKWRRESFVEEFLLIEGLSGSLEPMTRAIELVPSWDKAYFWRSMCPGTTERKLADLDRTLVINPRHAEAYLYRASSRHKCGDLDGAIADCDVALRIHPGFAVAFLFRGNVRQDKGDFDGAISDYDETLRINPRFREAYLFRGSARHAKGEFDQAIADYDEGLRIEPTDAGAYVNRGVARKSKGDLDGAIADYAKALNFDPRYAKAYSNRGVARRAKGDIDGAIVDYDEALRLNESAEVYNNRAIARQDKSDLDGALADFDEALRRNPRYADAYINRGGARKAKGDLVGALADFDEGLRLNPRDASAHYARGVLRQRSGRVDDAIADYDEALRLNPRYVEAYVNRGTARASKRDFKGASLDFEEALRLNPRLAEAYLNRGNLHAVQGDFDGAIADFSEALVLNPRYADAFLNRGIARANKGDGNSAIDDLKKALEVAPSTWPYRPRVEQMLRQLQR